jgi:DNA-binding Lrp family transcriptional regulator
MRLPSLLCGLLASASVAAATEFGARGFGVDIDPVLVAYATRKAEEAGVSERARFYLRDLFKTDVAGATVVTIDLLPSIMDRVAAKLAAELQPGARVVTHDYVLPGWRIERVRVVQAPEKDEIIGTRQASIYLFTVAPRATP